MSRIHFMIDTLHPQSPSYKEFPGKGEGSEGANSNVGRC